MHHYKVHTLTTAPTPAKPSLEALQQAFGLIPNLAATMAESPTLIDGFVGASSTFARGTLTGGERQLVLLTSAVANHCAWAVAFHSTAALREGVPPPDVDAVRAGGVPASDRRTAALVATARALVIKRGAIDADDGETFAAAGYTPAQLLEIIAGLGASLMANYAGNITDPPLDEPFRAQAWKR